MIPQKYYGLVLSITLSFIMGLLMSGIVTAVNTGVDGGFINRWLSSFAVVLPIAFISMTILNPVAKKIANTLTKS